MEHYYTDSPASKSDIRQIDYEYDGHVIPFLTDHGVFSMERVDHGTDILIHTFLTTEKNISGTVIDIGCGYGAIGVTVASLCPKTRILMTDVNERAMELAGRNAVVNHVEDRVQVGRASDVACSETAEYVITNPPIRAGKEVVYGLFENAADYLVPGGVFYAVIRKNQGAPSAVRELERIFGNCMTVNRQSGYHVLRCVKRADER